jgi:3-oxoacyl-(acyl-carrier-protein) synthase
VSGRRVVITGLGVVAPGGVNTKASWEAITSCRTATRLITAFDPVAFRSRELSSGHEMAAPRRPEGATGLRNGEEANR